MKSIALGFLCFFFSFSNESSITSLLSEFSIDFIIFHLLCDGNSLFSLSNHIRGSVHEFFLFILDNNFLQIFISGVVDKSLLGFAFVAGEQDKFAQESLESSGVKFQWFLCFVVSSVIHGNSNTLCELSSQSHFF